MEMEIISARATTMMIITKRPLVTSIIHATMAEAMAAAGAAAIISCTADTGVRL
jgi:hypothetical protein